MIITNTLLQGKITNVEDKIGNWTHVEATEIFELNNRKRKTIDEKSHILKKCILMKYDEYYKILNL